MFEINQIVKGKVAGQFVIVGFRNIGGHEYAQLKPYDNETKQKGRGEMALPLTAIESIN